MAGKIFDEFYEKFKKLSSEEKIETARYLAGVASREELEQIKQIVDKEIKLSEKTIEEGFEEDDRIDIEKVRNWLPMKTIDELKYLRDLVDEEIEHSKEGGYLK